jgi:hypothetical protein
VLGSLRRCVFPEWAAGGAVLLLMRAGALCHGEGLGTNDVRTVGPGLHSWWFRGRDAGGGSQRPDWDGRLG